MENLTIQQKQNSIFDVALGLSTFLLALYHVFPVFSSIPNSTYIEFMFFGMWLICYFFARSEKLDFRGYVGSVIIFALYTIGIPRLFDNAMLSNRYASISIGFTFFLAYLHFRDKGLLRIGRKIIMYLLPFYLFAAVRTIIELMDNPMASRSIKSVGEASEALLRQGVGGYALIYMSTILAAILLYLIINTYKGTLSKKKKLFLLILAVIVIRLIMLSNYFTALSIVAICFCLCISLKIYQKNTRLGVVVLVVTSVVLLLKGTDIFIWILESVINIFAEGQTLERLTITIRDLKSGNELSIFGSRDYTIERSRELFQENFILGTSVKPGLIVNDRIMAVGQHSHIWDTLAFYGLPAGILCIYLYIKPFIMKFREGGKYKDMSLVVGAATMILLYANNYTASICFAAYFVFPVMLDYIQDRRQEKKHEQARTVQFRTKQYLHKRQITGRRQF